MGNLFGSSKSKSKNEPSRVTEADKAVLQLKQQRDKLKQYQKKVQLSLERERQLAKKLLNEGEVVRSLEYYRLLSFLDSERCKNTCAI